MPKNTKGGKKHKTHKNSTESTKRPLLIKEPGQEYAIITKLLGNCRLEIKCGDDKNRLGIIRGSMKKKIWLHVDDYILIGLREFEDDKADIIHKYYPEEVNILKNNNDLPTCLLKNVNSNNYDNEDSEKDNIFFDKIENDSDNDIFNYNSSNSINSENDTSDIDIDDI